LGKLKSRMQIPNSGYSKNSKRGVARRLNIACMLAETRNDTDLENPSRFSSAVADLVDRVKAAAASRTVLRIRGGGTKDFYGGALAGEVLDTRALTGVVSYEPSELVVTVRAGTPLAELEALLAERGQCLPFEPPRFDSPEPPPGPPDGATPNRAAGQAATVGGMVASGLSGPARPSVGAVRDYMLGVVMLNGKGEHLTFGGQVMKNVAGYDVSRLMAGSLGTLGLLLEVSLKVLPVAPAEATLVFDMDEAAALKQLGGWGALPLPVNASCWIDGRLWVRLRGAAAAVVAARKIMGGEVVAHHSQSDTQQFWTALREQHHEFFRLQGGESLWRLSLPDTAPPMKLGDTLMEWGGAQRWVKRPAGDAAAIRKAAATASGHATLFRSADKAAGAFSPLPSPLARISRELQRQFDPHGIFNTGRVA
jgi:glycolate oxidase FAD binding subunit